MRPRGTSLLETVIACFLLTAVLLMSVQLFDSSLRYGAQIEQKKRAAAVAQSRLEELRGWAATPGGFSDWSGWDGKTEVLGDYRVSTEIEPVELFTPNRALESAFPDPRRLEASAVRAEVTVGWGERELALVGLIEEPPRGFRDSNPLRIELAAGTPLLSPGGECTFEVQAYDASGRELSDLFFTWYILPRTGTATVVPVDRAGRAARVINRFERSGGLYGYSGGECEVEARAVYCGLERQASWGPITLLKP